MKIADLHAHNASIFASNIWQFGQCLICHFRGINSSTTLDEFDELYLWVHSAYDEYDELSISFNNYKTKKYDRRFAVHSALWTGAIHKKRIRMFQTGNGGRDNDACILSAEMPSGSMLCNIHVALNRFRFGQWKAVVFCCLPWLDRIVNGIGEPSRNGFARTPTLKESSRPKHI